MVKCMIGFQKLGRETPRKKIISKLGDFTSLRKAVLNTL